MAMTADVSRALATFISSQGLGQDTARALADQYGDITTVDALPEWLTEQDADEGSATRSHLHVLVDGICTTCAPVLERRFDPSEPRIPGGEHGGEWGHGGGALKKAEKALTEQGAHDGGLPGSIVDTTLKTSGGTLHVGASPDREGNVELSAGGRSVSLSKGDIEKFRKMTGNAQYDMEEHRDGHGLYAVRRYDQDGKSVDIIALRPTGKLVTETGKPVASYDDAPEDEEVYAAEFDLFLGDAHGAEFGDKPVARVKLKDVDPFNRKSLYEALGTATAARRVDTGNGPTDVYVPRPGAVGLRMKDDNGVPTEVVFNARSYRRIDAAIGDVIYGEGEGHDGSVLAHHRDVRKVVETTEGPVEVRFRGSGTQHTGGYDPDSSLTIIPQYKAAWGVAASGQGISRFSDAFDGNGEAAGLGPS